MNAQIKTVISLVRDGGDWKQEMVKEYPSFRGESRFTYLRGILKEMVVQKLPVAIFKECLAFINIRLTPYSDDEWYELVVAYGTKDYFLFMVEEMGDETIEDSRIIFEEAGGKDRLPLLLEWIDDSALVEEMFKNYLQVADDQVEELDSGHKDVIATLIEFLKIDAYTYDWGAKDSVVNRWILSLLDQV